MSSSETDSLIQTLARQAGTERDRTPFAFDRTLLIAAVQSLAISVAMVLVLIGLRPDLLAVENRTPFAFKIASMLSLACGGCFLARRAVRPGRAGLPLWALLPGVLLLAFRAATDRSGLPVMGHPDVYAARCAGVILMVSMPALWLILRVLRTGAATRPAIAGSLAGLLSGALAATAYTLACINDAGTLRRDLVFRRHPDHGRPGRRDWPSPAGVVAGWFASADQKGRMDDGRGIHPFPITSDD